MDEPPIISYETVSINTEQIMNTLLNFFEIGEGISIEYKNDFYKHMQYADSINAILNAQNNRD